MKIDSNQFCCTESVYRGERVKSLRLRFVSRFHPCSSIRDVSFPSRHWRTSRPRGLKENPSFPAEIRNRRLQQEALQHLVQLLPTPNRETLWALLSFLSVVAANSEDQKNKTGEWIPGNKMDTTNLATVSVIRLLLSRIRSKGFSSFIYRQILMKKKRTKRKRHVAQA